MDKSICVPVVLEISHEKKHFAPELIFGSLISSHDLLSVFTENGL